MENPLAFVDILAKHDRRPNRRKEFARFEQTYKAEVTNVIPLAENINLFQVQIIDPVERLAFAFKPGQFIMLEVPGVGEAPFSISSSPVRHGDLELCIRSVGNLTKFLARIKRGTRVGVRGPFGTSFPVEEMHQQNVLLIAGGLGIAPLRSPISYVRENRSRFLDVDIVYGAKSPSELLFIYQYDMWRQFDINLIPVVEKADPAWKGAVGLITEVLRELCVGEECIFRNTYAIVCGPPAMFKSVCNMLTSAGIPMEKMFVSLERRMHCGMGKCCRCNVGSTYTCLEGPVFDYWTVMNLKEAI